MILSRPAWMNLSDGDRQRLRFVWDDTRASMDFGTSARWVVDAAAGLSLRAQMVLCVGLYEWILWRFDGLHNDSVPLQICEAAWCATVDPRYIQFFELRRTDWTGPVRGPLWCAATWLRPAVAEGDHNYGEVVGGLSYLTRLALHVVPDANRCTAWITSILQRFAALYPKVSDDPFADLFDHGTGAGRGELIGREALDPDLAYTIDMGRPSVASMLAQMNPEGNPFLAAPEQMVHAGFAGRPYRA